VTDCAEGEALRKLRAALERLPARRGPRCLRVPGGGEDPFAWLARCPAGEARALLGRGRCGIGQAWRHEQGETGGVLARSPFDETWLSLRFDCAGEVSAHWRPFGALVLWTPRLAWRRGSLSLHLREAADPVERQECRRLLDRLLAWTPRVEATPVARPARLPAGERRAWEGRAALALEEMGRRHPRLEKLVLAREGRLHFSHPATSPARSAALLRRLSAREPACWPWLLAWPGSGVWLGATPELFYRRRERRVQGMALAGTAPRGEDPARERRLGRALLDSDKERREHEVVADWLSRELAPLSAAPPRRRGPRLLKLGGLQHLASRLEGLLRDGVGDGELVARLHPTPALGGSPRRAALDWLRRHEGLDRGLFGGLLGVLEPGGAELRVAIRGALLQGRNARLWAGAGLVPGSDPAREWEETEAKLGTLAAAWGAAE
jgi:isochorismate synthase